MNKKGSERKIHAFLRKVRSLSIDHFLREVISCSKISNLKHYQKSFPKIHGGCLNLQSLFIAVFSNGGYQKVTDNGNWESIAEQLGLPTSCVHVENNIRSLYQNFLLDYELKYAHLMGITIQIDNDLLIDRDEYNSNNNSYFGAQYKLSAIEMFNAEAYRFGISHTLNVDKHRQQYKEVLNLDPRCPSEMKHLCLSLMSGLPNEVDYALNTLLLLSNSSPDKIRLSWSGLLLDFICASIGIVDSESQASSWIPHNVEKYSLFWKSSTRDNEGQLFVDNNAFKNTDLTWFTIGMSYLYESSTIDYDFIFGSHENYFPDEAKQLYQAEFQHVDIVAHILYNICLPTSTRGTIVSELYDATSRITTHRSNLITLSQSLSSIRLLFLLAYSKYSSLRKLGLQILALLRYRLPHVPSLRSYHPITALTMRLVSSLLLDQDRFCKIKGMEILASQCSLSDNIDVFEDSFLLPSVILSAIVDCLILEDVRLCLAALETLHKLCTTIDTLYERFVNLPSFVATLVSLLTRLEFQWSPKAGRGFKVSCIPLFLPRLPPPPTATTSPYAHASGPPVHHFNNNIMPHHSPHHHPHHQAPHRYPSMSPSLMTEQVFRPSSPSSTFNSPRQSIDGLHHHPYHHHSTHPHQSNSHHPITPPRPPHLSNIINNNYNRTPPAPPGYPILARVPQPMLLHEIEHTSSTSSSPLKEHSLSSPPTTNLIHNNIKSLAQMNNNPLSPNCNKYSPLDENKLLNSECHSPSFISQDRLVMPPPISPATRVPQLRRFANEWLKENWELVNNADDILLSQQQYNISRRDLQHKLLEALHLGRSKIGVPHGSEMAPPSSQLVHSFIIEVFPNVKCSVKEIKGQTEVFYFGLKQLKSSPTSTSTTTVAIDNNTTTNNTTTSTATMINGQHESIGLDKSNQKRENNTLIDCIEENHLPPTKKSCMNNGYEESSALPLKTLSTTLNGIIRPSMLVNGDCITTTTLDKKPRQQHPSSPISNEDSSYATMNGDSDDALHSDSSNDSGTHIKCNNNKLENEILSESNGDESSRRITTILHDNNCSDKDSFATSSSHVDDDDENDSDENDDDDGGGDEEADDGILSIANIVNSQPSGPVCGWQKCQKKFSNLLELQSHVYQVHIANLLETRQWSACMWNCSLSGNTTTTTTTNTSVAMDSPPWKRSPQNTCAIVRGPLSLYSHVVWCHCTENNINNTNYSSFIYAQKSTMCDSLEDLSYRRDCPTFVSVHSDSEYNSLYGREYPLTKHIRITAALILKSLATNPECAREILKHESTLVNVAFSHQDSCKMVRDCLCIAKQCCSLFTSSCL